MYHLKCRQCQCWRMLPCMSTAGSCTGIGADYGISMLLFGYSAVTSTLPHHVVQAAQKLRASCQEKLLQQLPPSARPAALSAAGQMIMDTSDTHLQHSAELHDEDPNAMNIDTNASCTSVEQGVGSGHLLCWIQHVPMHDMSYREVWLSLYQQPGDSDKIN